LSIVKIPAASRFEISSYAFVQKMRYAEIATAGGGVGEGRCGDGGGAIMDDLQIATDRSSLHRQTVQHLWCKWHLRQGRGRPRRPRLSVELGHEGFLIRMELLYLGDRKGPMTWAMVSSIFVKHYGVSNALVDSKV
jgi:hypothetical protein